MSGASLREALGRTGPLVIDSSITLSYLNGTDVFSAASALVFDDLVAGGSHPATLSAVTVTESLVHAFAADAGSVATVEAFLGHFANLRIRAIDYAVAREAARVRALTGLKTPDSLVVATALIEGIAKVVSTDDRWRTATAKLAGLQLVNLDAHLPL